MHDWLNKKPVKFHLKKLATDIKWQASYLGNAWVYKIFEFVKSIAAKHRPFSIGLFQPGYINKDPTVWLDTP